MFRVFHVNDVAFTSEPIQEILVECGAEVDFYQPATARFIDNKLLLGLHRLLLPLLLWWKARNYDLVYFHYATLAASCRWISCPLVLHCHGSDLRENLKNKHRTKTLKALQQAALIFYSTPDLRQYVPQEYFNKSYFLPNAVDIDMFTPADKYHQERAFTLFFISKLDRTKGLDVLLPLLEYVGSIGLVDQVYAFAHGNSSEVPLPSSDKIQYFSRVPRAQVQTMMQRSVIAIGQMELGAIGMSELEAMATGLPVIANFKYSHIYDTPPPLLQAQSYEEACAQLARLFDERERRQLGSDSREWVIKTHSLPAVSRALRRAFSSSDEKLLNQLAH